MKVKTALQGSKLTVADDNATTIKTAAKATLNDASQKALVEAGTVTDIKEGSATLTIKDASNKDVAITLTYEVSGS